MAKFNSKAGAGGNVKVQGDEEEQQQQSALSQSFCTLWNYVTAWTRDILVDPPTTINDCLNAFFDASELKGNCFFIQPVVCVYIHL